MKEQIFCLAIRNVLAIFFFLIGSVTIAQTAYTQNGGTATKTNETFSSSTKDESPILIKNSGQLTLTNCTINKTGDASSTDASSQYGTNAGVLANTAGKATIVGGTVTTKASGGNGLFATGTGSSISMSNGTISATGDGAHGVDATYGGSITLTNVNVTTTSSHSSAIATDFGGGTVTVTGGEIITTATDATSHSAGIYSTGTITVTDATVTSKGDCGGVIDGANSIILSNTKLTGATYGIMTWKTAPMSGSATVTINGGSLTAQGGDAFYVNGGTGNAANTNFKVSGGATINASTGNLINVITKSTATFTADGETLNGNLKADDSSTLTVTLQNKTKLTGTVQKAAITIDASSSWTLTANSYVTTFSNSSGITGLAVTNIVGNGHNVYYNSNLSANSYLGGKTYTLTSGGFLLPEGTSSVEDESSLPTDWNLEQNYPNPFNPETTISYKVQAASQVSLKIYDVLGNEVAVLVNEYQQAGFFKQSFNVKTRHGASLQSGVYFYQLRAGSFIETKKMMVMK